MIEVSLILYVILLAHTLVEDSGIGQEAYLNCYFAIAETVLIDDAPCKVWQGDGLTLNIVEDRPVHYLLTIIGSAQGEANYLFWSVDQERQPEKLEKLGEIRDSNNHHSIESAYQVCWDGQTENKSPFVLCISRNPSI